MVWPPNAPRARSAEQLESGLSSLRLHRDYFVRPETDVAEGSSELGGRECPGLESLGETEPGDGQLAATAPAARESRAHRRREAERWMRSAAARTLRFLHDGLSF